METREKLEISVTVNGETHEREVEPRLLLSDFIRDELGLTGTHVGCSHGVCGMCTITMDGETIRSCLTFAAQADGAEIETVESLGTSEDLHPIQQAFTEEHGLQCGFCTPAMLMNSRELLAENPDPSREEIRDAISNNLCRCTGYQDIIDAVELAADRMDPNEAKTGAEGDD
jgi:carbon-monoxide dehydrogenase small subunit